MEIRTCKMKNYSNDYEDFNNEAAELLEETSPYKSMIDLFIITNDEGKLIDIYTDKKRALKVVKPCQSVEHWAKNYDDGFEYVDEVKK